MKEQIVFTTDLFDSDAEHRNVRGGQHFGEDLAKWMFSKAQGSEFVFGEPVENANGWSEAVTVDGENFVLGFDIVPDSIGANHAEWAITIDKPRKWKLFGSKDSPSRGRLCDLIHNILRDEGQMREVRWGD